MTFKEKVEETLASHENNGAKKRIIADLHIKVGKCDDEACSWADFKYKKQEKYFNPYGSIHGGIACVIADTCMGTAIYAATGIFPSTSDMSLSYLSPMAGDEFGIHVKILHIGSHLVSASCEISDQDDGKLCVCVMARFYLVRENILDE